MYSYLTMYSYGFKLFIQPDQNVREARLSNGLVKGHAFTICNITVVETYNDSLKLSRFQFK